MGAFSKVHIFPMSNRPALVVLPAGPGALGGHRLGNDGQEGQEKEDGSENRAGDGITAEFFRGIQTGRHHIFPTLLRWT